MDRTYYLRQIEKLNEIHATIALSMLAMKG